MPNLIDQLEEIVGKAHILQGTEVTDRHSPYSLDAYEAGLLVRPGSAEEVAAICVLAHRLGVSLVPHGGVTGLVDGTASEKGNIILGFERMNRILRIDPEQMVLVAEAGASLESVMAAAADEGTMPGVDIPSRGSATLGGMTSTNAGGVRVLRYGMMRENILGLEAVLPDGTVLSSLNTLMKNNAGFDLKQLFIGTEGRLGLVTKVAIKLHPRPVSEETALVATDSFETLIRLLSRARQEIGADLLSFEAIWPEYYDITTSQPGFGSRPLALGPAIFAVIETAIWSDGEASRLEPFLEKAFEAKLVEDAALAKSESERQAIWRSREDSDAVLQAFPFSLSFDIGFELKDMSPFAEELRAKLTETHPELQQFFFGHMGDGNLHIMLGGPEEKRLERHGIVALIYETAGRYRGSTISAEHGIGVEKKAFLGKSRSKEEIALMQKLISTFGGGINEGKVV